MKRSLLTLRDTLHYRRAAFAAGLAENGFAVADRIDAPTQDDLLVIWNRSRGFDELAVRFEAVGASVLVVENGLFGKNWQGAASFSLALNHTASSGGRFGAGGPDRWDSWQVNLQAWRGEAGETVVLGQRGIGEAGRASPAGWDAQAKARTAGRVRLHPGTGVAKPLFVDLAAAKEVITWHSTAAMQALMLGVPVWSDCPTWIGAAAARPFADWPGEPRRDDEARLGMFRRAAWANWFEGEIQSGEAIKCTLNAR